MQSFGSVQLSLESHIALIELNDPAKRNAIGPAMVEGLAQAIEVLERHASSIRCLIITGSGTVFSSGGDMSESSDIVSAQRAGDTAAGRHYTLESHHHPVLRALRELHCPIITAVNGPAIGMGLGYALLGDLIVATRSARFVAGFVRVGMSPDMAVSWLLPRLIGSARAREMLMLGDSLSAETAREWGLINRVFDDAHFRDETMALARRLADGPPLALKGIRQLGWQAWEVGLEAHIDQEQRIQRRLGGSDDALEGFSAFLEKRAPMFRGY